MNISYGPSSISIVQIIASTILCYIIEIDIMSKGYAIQGFLENIWCISLKWPVTLKNEYE